MQTSNCTCKELTVMVVGQSQAGKTTLVNSLVCPDNSRYICPTQRRTKTSVVEVIRATTIGEDGAEVLLNVIDTPAVKHRTDWAPITALIEQEYQAHMHGEYADNFIHCCLYVLSPTGNGLSPLDLECMKDLCDKVNVIPVIAKADTLTDEECAFVKENALREIAKHKIHIYGAAEDYNKPVEKRMPLAVVSPNAMIAAKTRNRYSWNFINISNRLRNFFALREMLLNTHMQDLKYATIAIHYENFKYRKLYGFDLRMNVSSQEDQMDRRNRSSPEDIGITVTVNLYENSNGDLHNVNLCLGKLCRTYEFMQFEKYHEPAFFIVEIVKPNKEIARRIFR